MRSLTNDLTKQEGSMTGGSSMRLSNDPTSETELAALAMVVGIKYPTTPWLFMITATIMAS